MNKKILCTFLFFLYFFYIFGSTETEIFRLLTDLKKSDLLAYKPIDEVYCFEQGSLINMQSQAVFAIIGDGFFKVKSIISGEEYYTRSGFLQVMPNNDIMISPNLILISHEKLKNETIYSISISKKGIMTIEYESGVSEQHKINLYIPTNDSKITTIENYYIFSNVEEISSSIFYEGFLEKSSLDKLETLFNLQELLLLYSKEIKMNANDFMYLLSLIEELFDLYLHEKDLDFQISFQEQKLKNKNTSIELQILDYIHNLLIKTKKENYNLQNEEM